MVGQVSFWVAQKLTTAYKQTLIDGNIAVNACLI